MKKLFIPIMCSSVVLLATSSVHAGGLLKTVDVLCQPAKYNTVIKDSSGAVLFNAHTLMSVIDSRGGAGECINSGARNVYLFTPLPGGEKPVFNPIKREEVEKIVYSLSLKPIGGDAFRGNKLVLSGKVKPNFVPNTPPASYDAIVETGQKVIKQTVVIQPPAQVETTYKHIIR